MMTRFAFSFACEETQKLLRWTGLAIVASTLLMTCTVDPASAQWGSSWSRSWNSGYNYSYGNGGYQNQSWSNQQLAGRNYYTNSYGVTQYTGYVRGNNQAYTSGYNLGQGSYGNGYNNNYGRNYGGYYR